MPALSLDIKVPNNIEKMALKSARALEQLSKREAQVNAAIDKGTKSGKLSNAIASKARQNMARYKKSFIEQEAKLLVFGKKGNASEKQRLSLTKAIAKNYLMVKDAAILAFKAAKAMTVDAINGSNEFTKDKKAMSFEVSLWSSGTELGSQFAELEKFAKKTDVPIKEITEQFLKLRQASSAINLVSNEQAANLVKVYTDIRAISQSTERASKFMDEYTSKMAEGPDIAARFLAQAKAAHKEWADIGSGRATMDIAGPLATEDKWAALEKKISEAMKPLADIWNKVSGKLADTLTKFAESKEFKEFINWIAKKIEWLVGPDGIPKLVSEIGKFATKWADIGKDMAKSTSSWFSDIGDFFDKGVKYFNLLDAYEEAQKRIHGGAQSQPQTVPQAAPKKDVGGDKSTGGSKAMNAGSRDLQLAGITIQNLNVTGTGADAEKIARSVRQELQMLMQSGALSRGLA